LVAGALLVSGCAGEEPTTYGPTSAGPTTRPETTEPEPEISLPEIEEPTLAAAKSLCEMFSTAEISARLGLPVRKAVARKRGPYSVCTWTAVKPVDGGGVVTITRADAGQYAAFSRDLIAEAGSRKARGRKQLEGVGDEGFAIGASVSGVPIWYAAVVHGDLLSGVQLSGAGSKASVGTIKAFMIEVLARG
jgi:hypothetical protein